MKLFNLIFLFYFFCEITTNYNNYEYLKENTNINAGIKEVLNLTKNLNTILGVVNMNIENSSCINSIGRLYQDRLNEIEKIYEGSSKGFVDMNSFRTCISNESNTFFSIYPNYSVSALEDITRLNNDNLKEHLWIFGVCLKKDICNSEDIKLIFDELNKLFGNIFKLYNSSNIIIEDYREMQKTIEDPGIAFKNIIPMIFFLIQIIFMIFKIIPVKLFTCILSRRYLRETDKNQNKNNDNLLNSKQLTGQISSKIRKCFSISEIFQDFLSSNKSELFKDEDMTYLKGIKTLGIFFFIFGFNFFVIYNYPLCVSEIDKREKYMKSFGTAFLIICFRLSPALILSSSGFSLSYKFLNFLDKKLANITLDNNEENNNNNKINDTHTNEESVDKNNITDEKSEKSEDCNSNFSSSNSKESSTKKEYYVDEFGIKFYNQDITKQELNKIFKDQKINENIFLSGISTNNIPYSIYFNFAMRQFQKLVLLFLGNEVYKYFLPFYVVYNSHSPIVNYIYQTYFLRLGHPGWNYIYIGNFLDLFTKTEGFLMMQLFCIPMSELNYFVACSAIIFICYKKKWRLDIIILLTFIGFMIFKIVYITVDLKGRNPGMFYTDTYYQKFFFNPIYNFNYYLIGMFFGILNYVIQNGLTKKQIIKERPFIKWPLFLLKYSDYQKNKNYIHFIFIVIIMLFFLIIFPLLFAIDFKDIIENNEPNSFFIIMSLIDVELFLYCFYFCLLTCYVSGRNIIFKIFNASLSSYGMKLSFWIVFAVPTLTYTILYGNESNIDLSFFMVLFYGAITLINSSFMALLFFFILEMPYKKLTKLYYNISAEINKIYLEDITEEKNPTDMNELNENDIEGDNNNENTDDKEDEDEDDVIKDF